MSGMVNQLIKPNFFVIGAPKSGTTAMSEYLSDHKNVFFSDPKEPCYWCDDFVALRKLRGINSIETYLGLFAPANSCHYAIGEGSTLYLYSQHAIRNIMTFTPQAKFIVMVRNPIEIAHAYHMQMVFSFFEDEKDFEKAWNLQEQRSHGNFIPRDCLVPQLLQYREVARIGYQLDRLLHQVPKEQIRIILFDDFLEAPNDAYRQVLRFLTLQDDGRTKFPRINEGMTYRYRSMTKLFRERHVQLVMRYMKSILSKRSFNLANNFKTLLMRKKHARPPLKIAFRQKLIGDFTNDIRMIERITKRDLSHWMRKQNAK